ncbi:hypothetical protein LTR94_037081, partial [Friedmanniomyces endolithicus]
PGHLCVRRPDLERDRGLAGCGAVDRFPGPRHLHAQVGRIRGPPEPLRPAGQRPVRRRDRQRRPVRPLSVRDAGPRRHRLLA